MARKTKRQKEREEYFEAHKRNPYEASKSAPCFATEFSDDRLFAFLVLLGYPATKAYRVAYPQSTANASSAAVLASRRLNDSKVQAFIRSVLDFYWDGTLILNEACLKEKPRWRKWYGRKRNRFETESHLN